MITQAIIATAMLMQGAPVAQPAVTRPVALVEAQEDPAMLINLGVELARAGETEAARLAFEKVRRMRIDYTLETTDGRYVHPADLAAQGLRMLENGEFRSSDDTVLGG